MAWVFSETQISTCLEMHGQRMRMPRLKVMLQISINPVFRKREVILPWTTGYLLKVAPSLFLCWMYNVIGRELVNPLHSHTGLDLGHESLLFGVLRQHRRLVLCLRHPIHPLTSCLLDIWEAVSSPFSLPIYMHRNQSGYVAGLFAALGWADSDFK